jgi:hypothetical protein
VAGRVDLMWGIVLQKINYFQIRIESAVCRNYRVLCSWIPFYDRFTNTSKIKNSFGKCNNNK